jgi:hypothetical protein
MPTVVEAATAATWVTTDGCSRRDIILFAGRITNFRYFPPYSSYNVTTTVQLQLNFRLYGSKSHNNPQNTSNPEHPVQKFHLLTHHWTPRVSLQSHPTNACTTLTSDTHFFVIQFLLENMTYNLHNLSRSLSTSGMFPTGKLYKWSNIPAK